MATAVSFTTSVKRSSKRSSNRTGGGPRSSDTAIMIKKHPPLPCSIFKADEHER